ncbi:MULTISPECIES: DNA topoisomerase IB [unclassified Microbacterium]|uniref:DNA topoisomerase IB n=1 Tax=unclassified Microbacterium TaxID=2609290 RepID=UPI00214AB264|nr:MULTISPECIES: DNA topoisomerase IB [unclassified Microbacterium]MCR2784648.1 DNA topoisomerase IB [Microbacterium sp. zg.B96]MDL5353081.1 DNA topoisomerase IB [Microbacterium sp. zg-YB36]WIM16190.1 DNA topoisomerase IB [Microbacterium sp. zg-B96]
MARLRRVRPAADAGIRRVRSGSGFRYLDDRGKAVGDEDRERIRALVIPPAWRDVWISAAPNGHIQAIGVDDADRTQYLYHPDWAPKRDKGKYARALQLAEALPRARGRVTAALRQEGLDRERVLAAAFRLLDQAAVRIGSERHLARTGNRGLTTLQRRHATVVAPVVSLGFPGKSGKRQLIELEDADLAAVMSLLSAGRPGSPLLSWEKGRRRVPLAPHEVNAYVRVLTGGDFTAKDFRTLRGTIIAADALARIGTVDTKRDRKRAEVIAVQRAADALGNTPSVARGSYVDPRVFNRYKKGRLLDTSVSPESAIRALILPQLP